MRRVINPDEARVVLAATLPLAVFGVAVAVAAVIFNRKARP